MVKKLIFQLLLFVPVIAGCQSDKLPSGLMIEFLREPGNTKINDLKPEFAWIVPGNIKTQAAYQIIVAGSAEITDKNYGDIWDSGKINSRQSSGIEFGGTGLSPEKRYFWKVRIWDDKNKPTGYSDVQTFLTGTPDGYSTTANRFISMLIKPKKIVKTGDDHFFADFGKDAFGTLVLKIKPEENDTVIVHLGEKSSGMNSVDRKPGGSIRYQKIILPVSPGISEYTLSLPPDSRNTGTAAVHLPDSFGVITPFRYCELENCSYDIHGDNLFQKAFFYYFDDNESSFTCSDTTLTRIWDICKYSIKATSFTGIYIDGDRERIPYEADAYINQLGHYYTDREYAMARVTNEYFIKHPTWPTEWILHTVLMFYNDYMFTGNKESLEANYGALKHKTLAALAREDGLISSKNADDEVMKNIGFSNTKQRIRDIVDWPPAQKDTGWKLATAEGERDGYELLEINTVVNAFYYRNLVLMAEIAKVLGKNEDSEFYRNEAVRVRNSINSILLNKEKGIYIDGENSMHSSLHANMMPLAFGLVPDENRKSVTDFIKSRGMACSVYGSQYLLEGLYNAGEADYALSLMTATHDRGWWNMIKSGSTITMEAWDMKYKPNSDWNHAWGAAPANIIPGYMWGIAPAEPGFSKAVIRPQLSNLTYSSISVPTMRGTITAQFKERGKKNEYLITIPGNMECDLVIQGEDIIKLSSGLNKIIIKN